MRRYSSGVMNPMRLTRLFAAVLVALAAFVPAVAVAADAPLLLAAEESEESEVENTGIPSGAAVDAEPLSEDELEQPWTTRFLVPTVMALAVLGVLASIAYYAMRIRGRYTVVE